MKKVLIIVPEFLPLPCIEGGAIEQLIDSYLQYNSISKKYEITVYSPYSKKITNELLNSYNKVEFRYINKKSFKYYMHKFKYAFLRRIIKNKIFPSSYCKCVTSDLKLKGEINYYDLIIIENQVDYITTYAKDLQQKVVLHLHNDYLNCDIKNRYQIVECLNEVWGVSNFICNRVKKINNQIITRTLYNGVNLKKFNINSLDPIMKESYRKKYGFTINDVIVVYSGRIMPDKGVLELIKGFNIAKKKCKKLKLLIVGKKRDNSKEINDYYNSLLVESNKYKNDIIFSGFVSQDEIKYLYSLANIQVVPSLCNEAFGLIVVEGISAGLPLIVTNVGGIPEIVDSSSAIIIDKENIVDNIASSIIKLYDNKDYSEKIVANAKDKIAKFDVLNYTKNFEKCLDKYFCSKGD